MWSWVWFWLNSMGHKVPLKEQQLRVWPESDTSESWSRPASAVKPESRGRRPSRGRRKAGEHVAHTCLGCDVDEPLQGSVAASVKGLAWRLPPQGFVRSKWRRGAHVGPGGWESSPSKLDGTDLLSAGRGEPGVTARVRPAGAGGHAQAETTPRLRPRSRKL